MCIVTAASLICMFELTSLYRITQIEAGSKYGLDIVMIDRYPFLKDKMLWILLSIHMVCLEFFQVIEHVAEPAEFCKSLAALTIPDGATVISTINRSMRAYATAIVAAEYILRWVFYISQAHSSVLFLKFPRYIKKHWGCNHHNKEG